MYNFPRPKKPGDISIEWPEYDAVDPLTGDYMTPEGRIKQAVEKNEPVVMVSKDVSQGFVAVPDRREAAWKAPMEQSTKEAEKFFTFQKKNEEFQRLLDKEYEKLLSRKEGEVYKEEPFNMPAAPVIQAGDISEFERMLMDNTKDADFVTGDTLPINLEKVQAEVRAQEAARLQQNEAAYRIQREIIERAEQEAREAVLRAEITKQINEPEAVERIKSQNRERIDAMAKAREAYFQSEGVDISAMPDANFPTQAEAQTVPTAVEPIEAQTVPAAVEPIEAQTAPAAVEPAVAAAEENLLANEEFLPVAETVKDKKTKKEKKIKGHKGLRFVLILVLIPLLLETAVVGLRTFAPDSPWTQTASDVEGRVIDQVLEWGNTAKQFVIEQLEKVGLKISSNTTDEDLLPVSEPEFDLGALVSKYNKNIKSITESPTLGYESTGEYKIEGLADMGVVEDITLKEAVYACLISFNSKWVDYVNEGEDKSCLDLLKADGEAYRSALNFSKIGKIKEEFESLMLGEIRYIGFEYYVFVREHIAVTEEGKTSLSAYSWLYRLEDVAGELKIVDYTAFKN
ncbi:MAG: hypothetical protein EOM59_08260 [Clostridia bacterium]|nr:hypothetical protein [Clostridia bacterium]